MKAYHCYMRGDPDAGECIVFAEKESEAKKLYSKTELYEDSSQDYTEIRAVRAPEFDGCYRGHQIMDWNDPQDRKDYGARAWGLKPEIERVEE